MKNPLVSIQIPTYNQKEYIKEALDSALAQTYENLQIIVSDDCSPDYDIFEYLKDYINNPKVLIHRNSQNLGRVGNYRNCLYNLVKGDWFINLDGDDYFTTNDFVTEFISYYLQNEETNIVVGQFGFDISELKKNHKILDIISNRVCVVEGKSYILKVRYYDTFKHANCIFKTNCAKDANFYNIDTLDSDYFSRHKILLEGNLLCLTGDVYNWRKHENNATWSYDLDNYYQKLFALDDLRVYSENRLSSSEHFRLIRNYEISLFDQCLSFLRYKRLDLKTLKFLIKNYKFYFTSSLFRFIIIKIVK